MTPHIHATIAALAIALTPIPTPAPLPTPHIECEVVPVPSAAPCYCCMYITWRNWGSRGPERQEAPINCDCGGAR